jgi:hypothetical protein
MVNTYYCEGCTLECVIEQKDVINNKVECTPGVFYDVKINIKNKKMED